MVTSYLHQITTPRDAPKPFCAGIVVTNGIVTESAPILRYMCNWTRLHVQQYCAERGWFIRGVPTLRDHADKDHE